MNTVLTIDTSSVNCAVALQRGSLFIERVSDAQRQSAQRILPMISELLAEAEIQIQDLDLIAVVAGPGSFTGVRIGVAVAQGLSLTGMIPVVPLSSLALLAMASMRDFAGEKVLVSECAREGELYFAAYQSSAERGVQLIGREQVALIDDIDPLAAEFQGESWHLAGDGWDESIAILRHLGCSAVDQPSTPTIGNKLIAQLGLLRFECGEAISAAELRPNYVKEQLDYK